jgi:cytochrome c oxidase assembly protein subunit 15
MALSPFEHAVIGLACAAIVSGAVAWVARSRDRFRALVTTALALTVVLVVLGAYVRLSDAGLGCPDWPGCYGDLTPHHAEDSIRAQEQAQPGGPVSTGKAWREMIHRYLAMIVGSLIAAIMVSAWWNQYRFDASPGLATSLAALVILQALLGAWTVTLLLTPAIVTSHLLGGIAIVCLLAWLRLRQDRAGWEGIISPSGLHAFAVFAFAVLVAQIALGGWVSTNYAALACPEFPQCRGEWLPAMRFADAFHIVRELGMSAEGAVLPVEALVAIHWSHRAGAMVAAVVLAALGARLLVTPGGKGLGAGLLGLLALQLALGVMNVVAGLPLAVAVAHNAGGALLAAWMVRINYRLNSTRDRYR